MHFDKAGESRPFFYPIDPFARPAVGHGNIGAGGPPVCTLNPGPRIMSNLLILVLAATILWTYLVELTSSRLHLPAVIPLVLTGLGINALLPVFGTELRWVDRMLPILGKALGVTEQQMIECELIPEARGLVDFFVRSWIDIPLAECYAVHMEEEIFGFISRDFRQSLPKYGITNEDMKYFRVHEEADLDKDHGGTNQAILEVALQEGYGNERAGWPLEYCGKIAVQMIGNFYDGVYRRFA